VKRRPLFIGLTGGIASGKSTVAAEFASLSVPIVDTDLIARELVEPGQPALARIIQRFGRGVLDNTGALDRARLRDIVFDDTQARKDLEAILHPPIRALAKQRALQAKSSYVIIVIPLLVESSGWDWLDRVLVVDCDTQVQLQRLCQRPGISAERAQSIMAAQASPDQRRKLADDLLDNRGSLKALQARVRELDALYRQLAASRASDTPPAPASRPN